LDPAHLDLEASTLSRSFHRSRGNSRATAEEEVLVQIEEPQPPSEESKLSEVRLLLPPPVEGVQQPLTTTPANSRAYRTSSRRRVPASLPPAPPPGETTDEEVMGARAKIPLARAATVTAGSRQVPLKLLQGRSRHWSDPKYDNCGSYSCLPIPLHQSFEEEGVTRSHSDSRLYGRPGRAVLGEQHQRGHRLWGGASTSCCCQSPDFEPTSGPATLSSRLFRV